MTSLRSARSPDRHTRNLVAFLLHFLYETTRKGGLFLYGLSRVFPDVYSGLPWYS